jgi:hypothetical protein
MVNNSFAKKTQYTTCSLLFFTQQTSENYSTILLWIFLFWLSGFVILYMLGVLLSNYTMRTVEQQLTNDSITSGSTLRACYRLLINFAGLYYYISLPVILVLLVTLIGVLVYVFWMIGRIPIQLVLVMVVGACVTTYGMIRSLILKKEYEDPGRELKKSEAPELFALVKEVAKAMGTREIDEIRITPETDLAVYERGSWKEKPQRFRKTHPDHGYWCIERF